MGDSMNFSCAVENCNCRTEENTRFTNLNLLNAIEWERLENHELKSAMNVLRKAGII